MEWMCSSLMEAQKKNRLSTITLTVSLIETHLQQDNERKQNDPKLKNTNNMTCTWMRTFFLLLSKAVFHHCGELQVD